MKSVWPRLSHQIFFTVGKTASFTLNRLIFSIKCTHLTNAQISKFSKVKADNLTTKYSTDYRAQSNEIGFVFRYIFAPPHIANKWKG